MTATQNFEQRLVQSNDATVLRGKFLLSPSLTAASVSNILTINSSALGARAAALSGIFAKYRFKQIIVKFVAVTSGAVIGLLDDASGAEGDAPTSGGGVLELRASALANPGESVPQQLVWKPVDRTKWYYTFAGASGSDPRLTIPAIMYGVANIGTGTPVVIEVDYELVFSGAVDVGAV